MRVLATSLIAIALAGCGQQRNEPASVDTNAAMADVNSGVAAAPAATPASLNLDQTTWEFTEDGKPITETINADGSYVAWSGKEHVDHGSYVMKDGKACFTSAMNQDGEECWTVSAVEVGQSMETTSDKGAKLTVKRIEFVPVPAEVAPKS